MTDKKLITALRKACQDCNPTPCCEYELLGREAADRIERLKKEIFKYKEEAAKYKAERDKAVEDLADVADCITCKYDDVCENSNSQGCCNGNWQWRGLDDKTSTVLLPDIDVEVEVHELPVECALPQTVIEKIKEKFSYDKLKEDKI